MTMQPIIKRSGEGKWLNVLGMQLKFLCTSDDAQGRYSSMLNTVPKGLGAPPHKHPWDEAFFIIHGEVEFQLGDTRHILKSGDYVLAPAGTTHAFTGLSEEEGLMIAFESPGHSQRFFEEINDTVNNLPDDLGKMSSIGDRHQVTFVEKG